MGALEGMSSAIPSTLGCVTLVYAKVDPSLIGYGVWITVAALIVLLLLTARSQRPLLLSAPLLSATTLAAMLDKLYPQLPAWGLADSASVRLVTMAALGMGAGLWIGLLFALKAQRFSRYIPAPVYAGFGNAIALVLVISQVTALTGLLRQDYSTWMIGSITLTSLAAGIAAHRWRPHWPSAAVALVAGAVCGLGWMWAGRVSPAIATAAADLPWQLLPAWPHAQPSETRNIDWLALCRTLAGDSAILGSVLFINTTVAMRSTSQIDGNPGPRPVDQALLAGGMALAGLFGAVPMAGSQQANALASRVAAVGTRTMLAATGILALVYLSGVMAWVPVAAVCGALLCEAWYLIDRGSLRLMRAWLLQRRPYFSARTASGSPAAPAARMGTNAKEDLALIAAVTLCAVAFNMVAAALTGLVLGLFVYASRNGDRPVRNSWTGAQISSNCARSPAEFELLAAHAERIRVLQFEGDVFFGSIDSIDGIVRQNLQACECLLFDWSRVRHVDTSLARAMARLQQHVQASGIQVLHGGVDAGTAQQDADVAAVLAEHMPEGHFFPDMDRALEMAENFLIQRHPGAATAKQSLEEGLTLFRGLSPTDRALMERHMSRTSYLTGDTIFTTGEPSDTLLVVLRGTASVLVPLANGRTTRLAGVRPGATIGEIGFFDRKPRSATVAAQETVDIAILTRAAYETLSRDHPHVMQQLLSNVMIDVAARLRHTTRVAVARNTQS